MLAEINAKMNAIEEKMDFNREERKAKRNAN
jgi:hypothetical protein